MKKKRVSRSTGRKYTASPPGACHARGSALDRLVPACALFSQPQRTSSGEDDRRYWTLLDLSLASMSQLSIAQLCTIIMRLHVVLHTIQFAVPETNNPTIWARTRIACFQKQLLAKDRILYGVARAILLSPILYAVLDSSITVPQCQFLTNLINYQMCSSLQRECVFSRVPTSIMEIYAGLATLLPHQGY